MPKLLEKHLDLKNTTIHIVTCDLRGDGRRSEGINCGEIVCSRSRTQGAAKTWMESDGHNVKLSNVARCGLGRVDDVFVRIHLELEQDQMRIIAHGS